jgi:predicted CoA-binding protein
VPRRSCSRGARRWSDNPRVSDAVETLRAARTILVVDWPSADVPDSLVRAGHEVLVKGGPGPRDYAVRTLEGDHVVAAPVDAPPAHVDLLYAHRPADELPALAELARRLGAETIWWQSGLAGPGVRDSAGCWASAEEVGRVRAAVEAAGLRLICDSYIADAARGQAQ